MSAPTFGQVSTTNPAALIGSPNCQVQLAWPPKRTQRNEMQEIVNRTGWTSGNVVGILVTGPGGVRTAGSFDNGIGSQLVLHIEYTAP